VQLLEETRGIFANSLVVRQGVLMVKVSHEFFECELAITQLQDLSSGALDADGTFWKQNDALRFSPSPATTERKFGFAALEWCSHV